MKFLVFTVGLITMVVGSLARDPFCAYSGLVAYLVGFTLLHKEALDW